MKKQIITVFFLIAVIFTVIGFFVAMKTNIGKDILGLGKIDATEKTKEESFQAGWEAAKKRLIETGFYSEPVITGEGEIKNIDGQITGTKDNEIIFKIRPTDPFDDPELDYRIAKFDDFTKFYQLIRKDQSQYEKEIIEYDKKIQDQTKDSVTIQRVLPPEEFIKKEISFNNIKIGQQIIASSRDNISTAKEFVASEIIVQYLGE